MVTRRVRVNKMYDCPICGEVRSVEFESQEYESDDPEATLISAERYGVTDYGTCKVAAKATNPRKPTHTDLATCPIFKHHHEVR